MNRCVCTGLAGIVLALIAGRAEGALVALTGASRTYDQGGAYTAGASIDGVLTSGGWGVDGGQTTAQTAVFQTAAPLTASQLTFVMAQNLGGRHTINQFRISATTDPSPTVSSGATWTVLTPNFFNAGRNLLRDLGGSTFVRSGIAEASTYTLTVSPTLSGITGFRVETFVPSGGTAIGGASNGNFVLSEFMVDSGDNLALGRPVAASAATYGGASPLLLTDGRYNTYVHGLSGTATTFAYTVDLGQPVEIGRIDIFNRNDGCCPERLTNYRVSVHNAGLGGAIGPAVWSADVRTDGSNSGVGGVDSLNAALNAAGPFVGQWVKIEKIDNGAQNYWLQVAEVEVHGGYMKNWALGAPVSTSGSTYPGYPAQNLTDGNLNTFSHANTPSGGTFSYDIDLGDPLKLNSIYVYNRNDGSATERLSNYTVSVHLDNNGAIGPEVWSATVRSDGSNSGVGGVDVITAALDPDGMFWGQWIRVTGSGAAYTPQIAEVQVFANIPEPSTVVLLGLGGVAMLGRRWRRRAVGINNVVRTQPSEDGGVT